MKILKTLALILLIIGGLNWGSVGLFNYNFVAILLQSMPTLIKVIYVLVGASAVYTLLFIKKYL